MRIARALRFFQQLTSRLTGRVDELPNVSELDGWVPNYFESPAAGIDAGLSFDFDMRPKVDCEQPQ
jgi:hypothetical protein